MRALLKRSCLGRRLHANEKDDNQRQYVAMSICQNISAKYDIFQSDHLRLESIVVETHSIDSSA